MDLHFSPQAVWFSVNTDCSRTTEQFLSGVYLAQFQGICLGFQEIHPWSPFCIASHLNVCIWYMLLKEARLLHPFSQTWGLTNFIHSPLVSLCEVRDTEMNGIIPCPWRDSQISHSVTGQWIIGVKTQRSCSKAAVVPRLLWKPQKVTSCLREIWQPLLSTAYSRQG